MKALYGAAMVAALATSACAQDAVISAPSDGVVFVNLMSPAEGVSLDQLAAELTEAMEKEIRTQPGFRAASVHIARDGTYVLNYAQWDDTDSVDAVVTQLQAGNLPELAEAFSLSTPEFHPYDVSSVTLAAK